MNVDQSLAVVPSANINTISGNDPRSPVSQLEEPTPVGYRTEYLTFKQAVTTANDVRSGQDYL